MDSSSLISKIDKLENKVRNFDQLDAKWGEVWEDIKLIPASFKETRFENVDKRQMLWGRFQSIVDLVKEKQSRERERREQFFKKSANCLEQIVSVAADAVPPGALAEALSSIAIPFLSAITGVIDAVLPGAEIDDTLESLKYCSKRMKEGWDLLSSYKEIMSGKHKQEAFQALKSAQDRLDDAWGKWKALKSKVRESKRQAWEEKQEKHRLWEERVQSNIRNLEERLDKLRSVLKHKKSHLETLRENRDSAWNDDYRSRVEGWIEDEEKAIDDIESKIEKIKEWIAEEQSKLR